MEDKYEYYLAVSKISFMIDMSDDAYFEERLRESYLPLEDLLRDLYNDAAAANEVVTGSGGWTGEEFHVREISVLTIWLMSRMCHAIWRCSGHHPKLKMKMKMKRKTRKNSGL